MKEKLQHMSIRKSISHIFRDNSGSEAIETIYSVFAIVMLIMSALLILTYAVQATQVSYAAKRITRAIEVGGTANQTEMDTLLDSFLPNASELNAHVMVPDSSVTYFNVADKEIQLRQGFQVLITASYKLQLINAGDGSLENLAFNLPITVRINGQSEVYWKT